MTTVLRRRRYKRQSGKSWSSTAALSATTTVILNHLNAFQFPATVFDLDLFVVGKIENEKNSAKRERECIWRGNLRWEIVVC